MESWNILEILPPEVMILVFSNLEPEDIVSSLSVSKLWNALHSGFNWKEAFLMTFGELSSSIVDVTRKFNWRKLFFDRKTLSAMGKRIKIKEMLKFSYIPKKYIYLRAVTKDNVIYSIEENFYNIDLRLLKQDPTISKDKLIPSTTTLSSATFHFITSNNKHNNLIIDFSGHFSTNELPYVRMFVFWHLKKGAKAVPSLVLPDGIPKRCYNGDNRIFQSAKYILLHDRPHGCLVDTSKRCYHYCDVQKKGQIYERELFPTTCENKETCAIIDTWFEYYWYPFLSVEDPDLVVGIRGKEKDFVLVISRIGQEQKIEINLAKVITNINQVKIGSEHAIRSRKKIVKHWFSFEINNELYFIDLLDTTRKVKTAVVPKYDWIPNESKVVLQNKNILIVFDLETATRCSKLTFKRGSNIMDFSILPNRGFIAALENNGNTVSICQWETAAQARSIDVSEYHARSVKFISDNILLVYNDTWMSYIKL